MFMLPLTNDGCRIFRMPIDGVEYQFETLYIYGAENHWMLNIYDIDGNPLVMGINIVCGCPNLLKGQGRLFYGHNLTAVFINGGNDESDPDALGETLTLVWQLPGEEAILTLPNRWDLVTIDNPRGQ